MTDARNRAVRSQSFTFIEPETQRPVKHIHIEQPPIGMKGHCIVERGIFVLERGPCIWQAFACTHAGSGGFSVFDGVPDDDGFFFEPMDQVERDLNATDPNREGKRLMYCNPGLLGMWQLGIGCLHGLTVKVEGMQEGASAAPVLTITWMPIKTAKEKK